MYNIPMSNRSLISLAILFLTLIPANSLACACGCGVFDIGTGEVMPTNQGGKIFFEYDFLNQDKNWHGNSKASADDNEDKQIRTNFYTAGVQYMFNRQWGAQVTVPVWQRHFTTTDENTGDIVSFDHQALGDVRIKGIYSGFSPDMSSGLTFGLKLPTGDYTADNFDRDTQISTGSTDLLLGAYHMGNISGAWNWFANTQIEQPFIIHSGYRPGSEWNLSAGAYYNGWNIGDVKIAPMLQAINTYRWKDSGVDSKPQDSGYERVLIAPGVEFSVGSYKINGSVALPVYDHVRGNQLVAGELYKFTVSKGF
jgi:hypothetical protein